MRPTLPIAAIVLLTAAMILTTPTVRADDQPAASPARANLMGPAKFTETDGEALYRASCQSCHQANGQGGQSASRGFPALAKNPKLQDAGYPVTMVVVGHGAMPSFAEWMSDEQIAAVITFVRSHFGNDYKDPVQVADVKATRGAAE